MRRAIGALADEALADEGAASTHTAGIPPKGFPQALGGGVTARSADRCQ